MLNPDGIASEDQEPSQAEPKPAARRPPVWAGHFTAHWDGRDNHGQEVPSGVYIYRVQAGLPGQGSFVDRKKMLLMG